MRASGKIPATIVTGFLGAGKTSLIRYAMQNTRGRRIALLINEFGDVGVDGDILKDSSNDACPEHAIIELPNGGVVADDFKLALDRILAMGEIDHVMIEAPGLLLPRQLVRMFDAPQVSERLEVAGVIAVVDGQAAARGDFSDDPEMLAGRKNPLADVYKGQLACADLVVLNKTDMMSAGEISRVKDEIYNSVAPDVGVVDTVHGKVDTKLLFGIRVAVKDDVSEHVPEGEHKDFESIVVPIRPVADVNKFRELVTNVAEQHDILRMKGFICVTDKPMRYLVQAVGGHVSGQFTGPSQDKVGRLVVIGRRGLDHTRIAIAFSEMALETID